MLASYVLSRTLVPTMAMYLLRPHDHARAALAQSARRAPARVRAWLRADAPRLPAGCSSGCSRAGASSCRPSWRCACSPGCSPVAGRELLPRQRQRAVHPAPPGQDRHPHRGDRPPRRPGGGRRSGGRSPPASSTTSSTTSGCRTRPSTPSTAAPASSAPPTRDILVTLRKGHRPTEDHVRALRRRLPEEFPGVDLLLRARRHRDPDPQLRPARPDRHADRGQRPRGQPTGRRTR